MMKQTLRLSILLLLLSLAIPGLGMTVTVKLISGTPVICKNVTLVSDLKNCVVTQGWNNSPDDVAILYDEERLADNTDLRTLNPKKYKLKVRMADIR